MNEQQNIATIQKMYEAFGKGDVQTIVDQLDPNVKWNSHFDKAVPWAGDYTGRVPDFFTAIYNSVDVQEFDPQEFIAQGDTVVSVGDFKATSKKTGKSSDSKWAFIWKFKNGKVVSYEQFHDPKIAEIFRS